MDIYIAEPQKLQLFEKMLTGDREYLLSADNLERYCRGKTYLPDYAYSKLRHCLIEEFRAYLRQLESQGNVVLGCQKCGTQMNQGKKVTEEVMLMWDQIDGDHLYDTKEGYIYICPKCNSKYNSLTGKWRNSKKEI